MDETLKQRARLLAQWLRIEGLSDRGSDTIDALLAYAEHVERERDEARQLLSASDVLDDSPE